MEFEICIFCTLRLLMSKKDYFDFEIATRNEPPTWFPREKSWSRRVPLRSHYFSEWSKMSGSYSQSAPRREPSRVGSGLSNAYWGVVKHTRLVPTCISANSIFQRSCPGPCRIPKSSEQSLGRKPDPIGSKLPRLPEARSTVNVVSA